MRLLVAGWLLTLGNAIARLGARLAGMRPTTTEDVVGYLLWRHAHLPPVEPPDDESVGA